MKTKLMLAICAALLFSSAAVAAQSYDRDGNVQRQSDDHQGDHHGNDPRQNDCRQNDCRKNDHGQSGYREDDHHQNGYRQNDQQANDYRQNGSHRDDAIMHDRGNHDGWYRRGGVMPRNYRGNQYVVSDWRSHNLRQPPRGYNWMRSDNGDFLLVAVATGVITSILMQH
jgi:Ni/Co efflux regulator RcnB